MNILYKCLLLTATLVVVQSAVCTDGDCTNEADAASLLQGRLALESKYPDEIEDVEAIDDEEDPLHPTPAPTPAPTPISMLMTQAHAASNKDNIMAACQISVTGLMYAAPGSTGWNGKDMPGQTRKCRGFGDCRLRCAGVSGCAHFTYWSNGGCHLQDTNAILRSSPCSTCKTILGGPDCSLQVTTPVPMPAPTPAPMAAPTPAAPTPAPTPEPCTCACNLASLQ